MCRVLKVLEYVVHPEQSQSVKEATTLYQLCKIYVAERERFLRLLGDYKFGSG